MQRLRSVCGVVMLWALSWGQSPPVEWALRWDAQLPTAGEAVVGLPAPQGAYLVGFDYRALLDIPSSAVDGLLAMRVGPEGTVQWVFRDASYRYLRPRAAVVDSAGNLWIAAAWAYNSSYHDSVAFYHISADGVLLRRFTEPVGATFTPIALANDSNEGVYVLISSSYYGMTGLYRYSRTGQRLWSRATPDSGKANSASLLTDPAGNVNFLGLSQTFSTTVAQVVCYTPAGTVLWQWERTHPTGNLLPGGLMRLSDGRLAVGYLHSAVSTGVNLHLVVINEGALVREHTVALNLDPYDPHLRCVWFKTQGDAVAFAVVSPTAQMSVVGTLSPDNRLQTVVVPSLVIDGAVDATGRLYVAYHPAIGGTPQGRVMALDADLTLIGEQRLTGDLRGASVRSVRWDGDRLLIAGEGWIGYGDSEHPRARIPSPCLWRTRPPNAIHWRADYRDHSGTYNSVHRLIPLPDGGGYVLGAALSSRAGSLEVSEFPLPTPLYFALRFNRHGQVEWVYERTRIAWLEGAVDSQGRLYLAGYDELAHQIELLALDRHGRLRWEASSPLPQGETGTARLALFGDTVWLFHVQSGEAGDVRSVASRYHAETGTPLGVYALPFRGVIALDGAQRYYCYTPIEPFQRRVFSHDVFTNEQWDRVYESFFLRSVVAWPGGIHFVGETRLVSLDTQGQALAQTPVGAYSGSCDQRGNLYLISSGYNTMGVRARTPRHELRWGTTLPAVFGPDIATAHYRVRRYYIASGAHSFALDARTGAQLYAMQGFSGTDWSVRWADTGVDRLGNWYAAGVMRESNFRAGIPTEMLLVRFGTGKRVYADMNDDGCVDDAELLAVLFHYGSAGEDLDADIDFNGVVDDADLLLVLLELGVGCAN